MERDLDSFPVICETCGARLRVRDAGAIGEIHACPKCESMVQILPPAGWQTVSSAPSVVHAAPSENVLPDATPPSMEFVDVPPPPAPPTPASYSLVLGAIGGSALVLAGVAAVMWAGGDDAVESSSPVAVAEFPADDIAPVERDPYVVSAAEDVQAEPAKPGEDELGGEAAAEPATPELPELVDEDPGVATKLVPPAEGEVVSDPAPSDTAAIAGRPKAAVLKFDPLDFDPSRLSLSDHREGAARTSVSSIDAVAGDAETESEPPIEDDANRILPPVSVREQTLNVRRGPRPNGSPGSTRPGEQLALRVESLEVSGLPLIRFVAMISDLAGVPITVDPSALELAGVLPDAVVAVKGDNATLESLLSDVLSSRRLECVERSGGMRVALKNADKWRSLDYDVADLAGGPGASAIAIAKYVEQFVAPATWQAAGGKGTIAADGTKLHVGQSQAVHHAILVFCERLRLARGLRPQSRYPAERLSVDAQCAPAVTRLKQRTTFTFLPWTRLRDVAAHWQEASGLTILVDWSALASLELSPSSPVACSAIDRRWDEALDGILAPLELDWWVVDGESLAITSQAAMKSIGRVEFYEVTDALRGQFASEAALVEALRRELGARQESGWAMALDEPSGRLIVLGSPAAHRYLRDRLGPGTEQGGIADAAGQTR